MPSLACLQIWRCTSWLIAASLGLPWIPLRTCAQDNLALELESQFPEDPDLVLPGREEFGATEDLPSERLLGPLLDPECGITVEPVYFGEVFTNAKGGISTRDATQYEALLDLPVAVDFETLDLPLPGRFFLLVQNTHGRGLSQDFIGDAQTISNIDSLGNIMQVSEYWWEFGLLENRLNVRLGKQEVNTEFLVVDLAQDFIQASFGLSPGAGPPSYPNPSMAVVVIADLTESLRLKVGIWDALADGGSWGFSGNEATITLGELECKYALLGGRLPGVVDVGTGYASGGSALGLRFPSNYGYYVQVEQMLYREDARDEDDRQGLGVFASIFPRFLNGASPVLTFKNDFVCGIVYRGLFPGRDADVIGAGAAWARFTEPGRDEETAVDVIYKAQITPWLSLQPDLQYILSPSGIYRDALAVGLRFQMAF